MLGTCKSVDHLQESLGPSGHETPKKSGKKSRLSLEKVWDLVSHSSATADTISRDVPYSAIGFRGKLFLRRPTLLSLSLDCDRPFLHRKKWGYSSASLRCHRKHSATGVLLQASREGLGKVAKASRKDSFKTFSRLSVCPGPEAP